MTDDEAAEGFWRRVTRTATCWLWLGRRYEYGNVYWHGTMTGAHRIAWALTNGPIPPGQFVLHRCDHRGCVNPEHLFLGTHADNMTDMKQKGRAVGRTWNRRSQTGGIAMKTIGSAQFRIIYPSLTEPTAVTVNGHVIGQWIPAGATISVREYEAWIPNPELVEKMARAEQVTKLPGGGIQARQSQRDELLRKINRTK